MACIAFRVSFPTVLPSRSTLVQSILLLFSIALKCLEVFSLHTVVIFNFCKYSLFNSHRVKVLTPSEYVMSIRPFCVVLCQTTVYIEFCFVLPSSSSSSLISFLLSFNEWSLLFACFCCCFVMILPQILIRAIMNPRDIVVLVRFVFFCFLSRKLC